VSGCDGWQADGGIIAQGCDGFQAHVGGALHGPLIVLFEQQGPDEPGDGGFIGEAADHLAASFDFAVEAFEWIGAVDLGAILGETNPVSFLFDRLGVIRYPAAAASADDMLEAAKLDWRPTTSVTLDEERAGSVLKLLEVLEDNDDVQNVYANFDIPDAVMQKLSA